MTAVEKPWPPLIIARHPPKWVKSRDHLLTLLMWIVFAVMLETEFELFFGTYFERWGFGDFNTEPNWVRFIEQLMPFLQVALALVALLLVATFRTLRRRKRGLLLAPPVRLGIAEELRRAGIDEAELTAARAQRIVVVHISPEGNYRIVAPDSLESP